MADATYTSDAAVVDGTAAVAGTAGVNVIGGIFNDGIADLGSGNAGAVRLTSDRAMHVNLRTSAGVEVLAVPQYDDSTTLGAVGNATGTVPMARSSLAAPTSVTDNDAVTLWASRFGALNVIGRNSAGAALSLVSDLSTAPNVMTAVPAMGIGPGFDRKLDPANLGTAVNSAITNTVDGADIVYYHIGTGTTGTFTFEVTADDTNWTAADHVNAKTGAIQTGNITPAANDVWRVAVSGWRQVRIRTVTTLGATVAVKTTAHLGRFIPGTWRELTNARAGDVAIVDGSGNHVTSFGGTQYVEDVALGATPTGTLSMAYGSQATPTAVSTDGDAVSLWASTNGSLNVILRNTAGAQMHINEDAVATAASGFMPMARRDDALATLTPIELDAVPMLTNSRGALWVSLADAAGNQVTSYVEDAALGAVGSGAGFLMMARAHGSIGPADVSADGDAVALWADHGGALNVILRNTAGTSMGFLEDTSMAPNVNGFAVMARRDDALSALTPVADDAVPVRVDSMGALWVRPAERNPTATPANVASSASSVTILAANTLRVGATVFNDSTQILYLKFGATASLTSFTVRMVSMAYYEVPFGYTGIIDGIWASANGNARVTEVTM